MDSSTKIDVEYEVDTGDDDADALTFQDIPHNSEDSSKTKTHEFTNFPHSAMDSDDEAEEDSAKLLKEDKASASSSSFWTFAYYQQFFDVDTQQVGTRIIGSMFPKPGSNYLLKEIRPKPDLYGPFWICTTLIFTTAIAGNLANYFSSAGKDYHWKYDFHKVTFAATAIYSYWWFIPLILFGLLWWRGSRDKLTFLEIICVYGYSLAIYIPISVLWAIQVSWLQWTLVMVGAVLSGSVLLMNFWPIVSEDNKKIALGIMAFIFIMHAALAVGFVLYFFYVPVPSQSTPVTPITNTTVKPVHIQNPVSPNLQKAQNVNLPANTESKVKMTSQEQRVAKDAVNKSSPQKAAPNNKSVSNADGSAKKTDGSSQSLTKPAPKNTAPAQTKKRSKKEMKTEPDSSP